MYLQGAGGSVVDCPTLEREVSGSKPTSAMLVLEQDMLLPESTGNTQEASGLDKKLWTETFSPGLSGKTATQTNKHVITS